MKTITLLALSALACASCSRQEAIPGPEASYSRTVAYPYQATPTQHDTIYQSPALGVEARLSAVTCAVQLQPATKKEGLALTIPRGQMPAGLVGRYTLGAPSNPSQAPSFHYSVDMPDKPLGGQAWSYASWWLPATGAATGTVEITTYDAKRHLLSGRFQLVLTSVQDPRALSTEFRPRRCDLTLAGTFANVVVTDVP